MFSSFPLLLYHLCGIRESLLPGFAPHLMALVTVGACLSHPTPPPDALVKLPQRESEQWREVMENEGKVKDQCTSPLRVSPS